MTSRAGIIGVSAAGYVLDQTGSWARALFLPAAFFQVIGTILFVALGSGERQGWDEEPTKDAVAQT
jgi:hypothetical protein